MLEDGRMKVVVTVVKIDVEAWNAQGPPHGSITKDNCVYAYWIAPNGVRIDSKHVGSEAAALASLQDFIYAWRSQRKVSTVRSAELEL